MQNDVILNIGCTAEKSISFYYMKTLIYTTVYLMILYLCEMMFVLSVSFLECVSYKLRLLVVGKFDIIPSPLSKTAVSHKGICRKPRQFALR